MVTVTSQSWQYTLILDLVLCGSQLLELHARKYSKSPSSAWDLLSQNWLTYLVVCSDPRPGLIVILSPFLPVGILVNFYLVHRVNQVPQGASHLNLVPLGLFWTRWPDLDSRGVVWKVGYSGPLPWHLFYGII